MNRPIPQTHKQVPPRAPAPQPRPAPAPHPKPALHLHPALPPALQPAPQAPVSTTSLRPQPSTPKSPTPSPSLPSPPSSLPNSRLILSTATWALRAPPASHHHHHPRHLQLIIKALSRLRHLSRQSSLVPRLFPPRSSLASRLLRPRSRRLRRRVLSLMLRRLLRALLLCKRFSLSLFFLCDLDVVVGRRLTFIFLVGKTRKSLDTLVFAKVSVTAHRLEVDAGGRRFRLLRIAVWIVCESMK